MSDWVPIEGFPKYSVDPLGRVRHDRKDRILQVNQTQRGVTYVVLMRETRHVSRGLALLTARAFLPQPSEAYDTAINLNGDRFNCAIDNLTWRPRWFALKYHKQFKERYFEPVVQPVRNVETGEEFLTGMDAVVRYGILEWDLYQSIYNNTVVWPILQRFEWLE